MIILNIVVSYQHRNHNILNNKIVAQNKSSLLLKNVLQNTQTLQLFTMNIKTEFFYKHAKLEGLGRGI